MKHSKGQYRRGKLLTWAQVKALPDGAIVWIYCEKDQRKRLNEAVQIERTETASEHDACSWSLGDAGDLAMPKRDEDSAHAIEYMSNYVTWVHEAVEVR